MSFEGISKRRRIVQKLDFENCIVTNIKTTARRRKKLRARIIREFEHDSDIPEVEESFDSSLGSPHSPRPPSPVLIMKPLRNIVSAASTKEKKTNSPEKEVEELESSTIEVPSSPGSPVFRPVKKQKIENVSSGPSQELENVFESEDNSNSSLSSSLQIEDFTQESKQSVKISSVESPVMKSNTSSNCSGEPSTCNRRDNPTPDCFRAYERSDSLTKPVRRNYKKNSLLGRLRKIQQKQASEKLLWQHQNRKNSSNSLSVSIVSFWTEEFNYFLKCQSCLPGFEITFVVIDCRWVPNVKKVKEGSVLQLHPPWQKLKMKGSEMTVLLSVICLDVLDETKDPILRKETFEVVPADRLEVDKKLFVDSLFSSCGSVFLL